MQRPWARGCVPEDPRQERGGPDKANQRLGHCYAAGTRAAALEDPGRETDRAGRGPNEVNEDRGRVLNLETDFEVTGTHLFQKQKPGELMAEGVCLHPCRLF